MERKSGTKIQKDTKVKGASSFFNFKENSLPKIIFFVALLAFVIYQFGYETGKALYYLTH